MAPKFRILSLDGGGSWSILQVDALLAIYGDLGGHELLQRFDLVAANSGGSIVAAALFSDLPLSEISSILSTYEIRKTVFRTIFNPIRLLGIGPKYATKEKLRGLESILSLRGVRAGNLKITDIATAFRKVSKCPDLVITAFDYDKKRSVFFRSNASSKSASRIPPAYVPTLVEAVHASSTAPVNFFDSPASLGPGMRFWDGAIGGYNNPLLAAVIEAIANKTPRASIVALSIGTGGSYLPLSGIGNPILIAKKPDSGLLRDIKKLAMSIVDDPPDAASFSAHVMLGGKLPRDTGKVITDSPIVRMNPLIRPVGTPAKWDFPGSLSSEDFEALLELGLDAVEPEEFALVKKVSDLWISQNLPINQPIRMDSDLNCEIGFDNFVAARKKAIQLF